MPLNTEDPPVTNLKGTPQNPGNEPRKRPKAGPGSIGDTALKDGLCIVVGAWVALFVIWYSLRHYNV